MDGKIVLVYERTDSGRYLYELTGIIIPTKLYSRELPCSPHIETEPLYLDPIYDESDEKELKRLRNDPNFISLDC